MTSDSDFLHVDRREWVQQVLVMGFLKKVFQSKWAILSLEMVHPHNFGSALRIFLKFCTMKEAKKYMEIILMVFLKNSHLGQMGYFESKNGLSSKLWINSEDCFEILLNETDQVVHGAYINGFLEKNSHLGQMGHFGPKMACCHNSGSTLRIFFEILLNERG